MHSRLSTIEHDSSIKEVIENKKKHRKRGISPERDDVVEHIRKKHKCDVFDDGESEKHVNKHKHKHHLQASKLDNEVNKYSEKHKEIGLLYWAHTGHDLRENTGNAEMKNRVKQEADAEECEDSQERIHKAKKKRKKKRKHDAMEREEDGSNEDKQNEWQSDHVNEKSKKKKKHLREENWDATEEGIEHKEVKNEQIIIEDEDVYEGMEIIKKKHKKKHKRVMEGDEDANERSTMEAEEIEGIDNIKKKHKKKHKKKQRCVMEGDEDGNERSTVEAEEIEEGIENIKKKHKKKHKKKQRCVMEGDEDAIERSTVEAEEIEEEIENIKKKHKKKHKKKQRCVVEGDEDGNARSTVEAEEIEEGIENIKKKHKKKHKCVMEGDEDANERSTVEIDKGMQSTGKKHKKKHKHKPEEIEIIKVETENTMNCSKTSMTVPQTKQKTSPCSVIESQSTADDALHHSPTSDVVITDGDGFGREVNEFNKEWSEEEEQQLQANWDSYFQEHPYDEPENLLIIPADVPLAEKRKLWRIRKETHFFESLCLYRCKWDYSGSVASGIDRPLAIIRNKAEKMFTREEDKAPKKHSTLNRWSAEEIKQLEYNWANFFRDHPVAEPYDLLAPKHVVEKTKRAKLMKFKRETCFLDRLREGINRTALSVYHEAKRHFNPYIEVTGKLDEDELFHLKKLIALHGKKLLLISTLMGRSPVCIEAHFQLLEREEKKCNTGKWSVEEEKRLTEAIQEQVGFDVTEKKNLHNKKRFNNINWPAVAERVRTRHFHQCFHKWMYDLSSKVVSGVKCHPSQVEGKLVQLIKEQNVKENSDIDWMALYEQFDNVPSPSYLKCVFNRICRKHIPNFRSRPLEDILSFLYNVYARPKLKVYN